MAGPDTARNDRLTLVIVLVTVGLAVALAITVRALLSIGPASEAEGAPAAASAGHIEGAVAGTSGGAASVRRPDASGVVRVPAAADPRALVGRQVEIDVVAATIAHDIAFWEGDLLVVVGPDVRARMAERGGETIRLAGVIEPLPHPEAMMSWGLTAADLAQLTRRGVYLRAIDVVAPHHQPASTSDPATSRPAN